MHTSHFTSTTIHTVAIPNGVHTQRCLQFYIQNRKIRDAQAAGQRAHFAKNCKPHMPFCKYKYS